MTPSNITPGKSVGGGRYIINKQLGDNANFWLAHDEIENKPVVLKFLASELYQDPRGMEEMRNQVSAVSKLSHPNIAQIYDLYEVEGEQPFIIGEYIEGMNLPALQSMQPQRVFTWVFLAPLLKQILSALEVAHQNGLIQGSQKPSNIMLDRKGQIKVLDVGIAGILNNPLYGGSTALMPYLSPQQVDGNPATVTDDIYSLGILIYQFLTSTVPFHTGDILPQIQNTPAQPIPQRLSQLRISNAVPQLVTSIVMSCLDKNPTARPQSLETISNSVAIAELEPQRPAAAPAQPQQVVRSAPQAVIEVAAEQVPQSHAMIIPPSQPVPAAMPVTPPAKKSKAPVLVAVVAVVVAMAAGIGGVLFFLKKQEPANQQQAAVSPTPPTTSTTKPTTSTVATQPTETTRPAVEHTHSDTSARPTSTGTQELSASEQKARKSARDAAELAKLAARSESGFQNLFNGQDLTGWTYDQNYWSVEGGFITARAGSGAPQNITTDLVWQDGNTTIEDFELRFQYRFRKMAGNSQAAAGVEYRGIKKAPYNVEGYHYEITLNGENTGMLTCDGRSGVYAFASKSRIFANTSGHDKVEETGSLEPFSQIAPSIKAEEWNECIIVAKQNHLIHKINGHVVADVTDENEKKRILTGALGFELKTGAKPAVFFQLKNIRLKRLAP